MKLLLILTLLSFSAAGQGALWLDSTMIDVMNKERSKHLLRKLSYDGSKQESLNDKAKRMSAKNGFRHDNGYWEIIQINYIGTTPASAIKVWMNSPGHRKAILTRGLKTACAGSYIKDEKYFLVIRMY
jgi:uncharacterized protein YkwD